MRPATVFSLSVLLLWCCGMLFSAEQDFGTLSGTVTGSNGAPLSYAKVTADYVCSIPCVMRTALNQTETDSQGRYSFQHLPFGRYALSAEKATENYPPLRVYLYSVAKNPEIELSTTSRDGKVDLKLTTKAGVLTGTVADEETGTPIAANVELKGSSDPNRYWSGSAMTNARFRVLVPSDTSVFVKVSKEGYSDWSYTRNGQVAPLRLGPDETLALEIKLKKVGSD